MCVVFIFDNTDGPFYTFWLTGNFFCDFVYFIDIYINLKLIYMEDGLYVTSFKKRALKYLKTYGFAFDIISILPSDLFLLLNRRLSVIRINRLFKLNRVIDFVNKQNIKTNFPNGFRIFHIFVACMTLFHWNCSAYYTISLFTGTNSTNFFAWEFNYVKIADPIITTCDNWLNDMDENCQYIGELPIYPNETDTIVKMMNYWSPRSEKLKVSNFTKQYMLSIYWSSLTLTTSGQQPYPTLSSHILLEVFDTIVGMLIFAVIVGSVGNVVATMNKDKTEFQNLMDGLKFYMDYRHVQPVVQKRVKDVVAYNQKYGMIKDEANIMAGLPQRLKGELAVHLHMENLKRVKLLRDCDPSLLYELVLKMEMQMFAPNDMLCRKGELAREMYIVKRGTLELLSETGKVVNQLKEGASFGELAILKISGGKSANRRSRSLRSVGYSDVYVLKREEALAVLQDYPDQRNKLIEKAKQMIRLQTDMFQEFEGGFDEDLHEISGTQNTDETLVTLSKSISSIEEEISNMYQEFLQNSTEMKQRVTQLEKMYFRNHRRIRQYNAQRMANQLTSQPRSP
uniref:Cyclic nucleotide-binding domain-containing protein n=1 Tax=Panagrolaimus sp. PS1159 TaxID=55785 RepID=A0AC35ERH7_9BILA